MKKISRKTLSVLALGVLAAASVTAPPAAADQAAIKALYDKAKSEKEVIIWGPQASEVEWVPAAFGKEFPALKVKWNADLRSGPKIIAEARAGRTSLDVFVFSLGGMLAVQKRGLLKKGAWDAFGTPKDARFFGEQAGASHNLVYVAGYNDQKVKRADLPNDWDGFLDAKWQGKLMASPFLLPRLSGFLAMEWGEEKTANWLRSLINKQKIMITRAPAQGVLASAERVVTITTFSGQAQFFRKGGAPVSWKSLSIVPAVQMVAGPMKNANHSNAALLLAGWITTDRAAAAREAYNFNGSVRPGSKTKLAKQISGFGGKVILEDPKNMKIRAGFYKKLSPIVTGRKK